MNSSTCIFDRYDSYFASSLKGRYITLEHLNPLLHSWRNKFEISIIGTSEQGKEIPMIRLGSGTKKILAWSQMHGNESTTTKAIMDLISFLFQTESFQHEITQFLQSYELWVIPILNPDGAENYTRFNGNGVDLNRDAQNLTQSESRALVQIFDQVQPDLCLNLHDQRTFYGTEVGLPATISFLAPAFDDGRTVNDTRSKAMKHIERMSRTMQQHIPGQIGRYDDAFNINCVGDTFQQKGVPTILFEAGHYPNDYTREQTRRYIFRAFLELFHIAPSPESDLSSIEYENIPENNKMFRDVLLRNIVDPVSGKLITLALQYEERLIEGSVEFQPVIDSWGELKDVRGHLEIDAVNASILVNSQEKFDIGEIVSTISHKTDNSIVYFSMKSFK